VGRLGLDIEKGMYLGIDFGTTNSVMSLYDYDTNMIETIPIEGNALFPTVIQFEVDDDDETKLSKIYGVSALEAAIIYPESTILGVKRLLGQEKTIEVRVRGQRYEFKVEDVVAELFAYLKEQADQYLLEEKRVTNGISGCVITVPANSTDRQKRQTKEAAIKAGFDSDKVYLRLEPAAAALAYVKDNVKDKRLLVYDFGGGTFDACVLQVSSQDETDAEPELRLLSTYGDNHLGGNDFDQCLVDMLYDAFLEETKQSIHLFDLSYDDGVSKKQKKMARIRLKQMATYTKERLSSALSAKVVLAPLITEPYPVNLQIEITRDAFYQHKRRHQLDDTQEDFEKMKDKSVLDLIHETLECVEQCLSASGLNKEAIDEIFLVGGSSSVPEVALQVEKYFGKMPYQSGLSPALSISQGAALYCKRIMMPNLSGPIVVEQTIHPLGIEIAGRRFMEIIDGNVMIPDGGLTIEAPELLETNYDQISSMAITVYEDTQPDPIGKHLKFVYEKGMRRLGGTTLHQIPLKAKGEEKVKVVFHLSQENLLTVKAISLSDEGIETELSVDDLYH
jgi:molecular chaperone DnaK